MYMCARALPRATKHVKSLCWQHSNFGFCVTLTFRKLVVRFDIRWYQSFKFEQWLQANILKVKWNVHTLIYKVLQIVYFTPDLRMTLYSNCFEKQLQLCFLQKCFSCVCMFISISQEICTRFLLCCALLWLYIDWFSHIHQAYFTGTVAI